MGPRPVINGVVAPISRAITVIAPVNHLEGRSRDPMYCTPFITIVVGAHPLIKGQLGVPMVFIVFSDGILGDNLPINTHYIGLISI